MYDTKHVGARPEGEPTMITNRESGTSVHEIGNGPYRISTPIRFPNGVGFTFNQYLLVDEAPLLFHTGLRRIFPLGTRGGGPRAARRAAPLHRVLALRGRRVRLAERVA
jgi:hypothetical protein